MTITSSENIATGVKDMDNLTYGMVNSEMDISLTCKFNKTFSLSKANKKAKNIFVSDFKFEEMGIGGLDS